VAKARGWKGLVGLDLAKGVTCEQAKRGGLLPSQCHVAGYSFEEAKEVGFKGKLADWMAMDLTNPHNKW